MSDHIYPSDGAAAAATLRVRLHIADGRQFLLS